MTESVTVVPGELVSSSLAFKATLMGVVTFVCVAAKLITLATESQLTEGSVEVHL